MDKYEELNASVEQISGQLDGIEACLFRIAECMVMLVKQHEHDWEPTTYER